MIEQEHSRVVFTVTSPERKPFCLTLAGRNRWAMEQLVRAGRDGCTSIDNPAPRWSAYVFNLRQFGVAVETVTENHGGEFAGNHARYILVASVTPGAQEVRA